MPHIGFALSNFVCMVRERIVDSSAVEVEVLSEVLHADAGALDMPSGIADTPRTVPFKLLVVELGLCEPEHKVSLIALVGVLLNALTNADSEILLLEIVENIVLLEL